MKKAELGQYFSNRRKSLKVNQRLVADLCGLSIHSLSNIERGEGNPTLESLEKLADVLGLEISLAPKQMGMN